MFVGTRCIIEYMTKLIITFMLACGLVFSAVAGESLFNAKEVSVNLGTGYVVDTSAAFQQEYTFNLAAGTTYFLTKNLGVEAWVPFYTSKGVSVQEVQAGALLRVPLGGADSFFGHFAPYVGVGGVYNWETEEDWAYVAKVGSELRLNKKWGLFVEGQYRNVEFDNWGDGQVNVFGGVKLVF